MSRVVWPPPAGMSEIRVWAWAGGLQVAVLVGEPDERAGVADVDPLRIRSGRIEIDPERAPQPGRRRSSSAGALPSAEMPRKILHLAGAGVGDEVIAIGSPANLPGIGESFTDVKADLESGGRLRHRVRRDEPRRGRQAFGRTALRRVWEDPVAVILWAMPGFSEAVVLKACLPVRTCHAVGFGGVEHQARGQNQQSGGEDPVERFHSSLRLPQGELGHNAGVIMRMRRCSLFRVRLQSNDAAPGDAGSSELMEANTGSLIGSINCPQFSQRISMHRSRPLTNLWKSTDRDSAQG